MIELSDVGAQFMADVAPFTMENTPRIMSFAQMVETVLVDDIPGDIVECGVYRGGMMMLAAKIALYLNKAERPLWLYDTFRGMSEPEAVDIFVNGESAMTQWQQNTRDGITDWCLSPLDEVRANMASTGYPANLVRYVEGKVEDTLPLLRPDTIAILRLDTDWYASTKVELELLFDALSVGGFFVVADFSDWQGSHQATLEYFADKQDLLYGAHIVSGTFVGRKRKHRV